MLPSLAGFGATGPPCGHCPQFRQRPDRPRARQAASVYRIAHEHGPSVDDVGHAFEEIGRRAVIDGDEDDAFEQATPQRNDPLRPVLSPDRNRLSLDDPVLAQPLREAVAAAVTSA